MEYLGKNDQGHCFECPDCQYREYTNDPEAPITPHEVARKSMLEWSLGSRMGKGLFRKVSSSS